MATILFVGSNPSNASTCDIAFHGSTKSSKILTEWTKDVTPIKCHINVMNKKTERNRPLNKQDINANLERLAEDIRCIAPDRVVALGKTAAQALTLLRIEFYEMPHPSGLNRKLNDPEYVAQKIKELTKFCNRVSSNIDSN